MSFADDIKSKDINIYPVIIIDKASSNNSIYLSTNSTTINGQYYTPILLNIPSLKESIDIEKRNYKISNISISISNYEHNGKRFSDTVANSSLINKSVDMYWISPSATNLGEAKHVYTGWILRYDIGSDKIKIDVEDRSQAKLNKELPDLLTADAVPDEYKNKPIPIVYGKVDKSPLVVSYSPIYGDVAILGANVILQLDKDSSVTPYNNSIGGSEPDIYLHDEHYIAVSKNTNGRFDFPEVDQYSIESNFVTLGAPYESQGAEIADSYVQDPISIGRLIMLETIYPKAENFYGFNTSSTESVYWPGGTGANGNDIRYLTNSTVQIDESGNPVVSGTVFREALMGGSSNQAAHAWMGESATEEYCNNGGYHQGQPAIPCDDLGLMDWGEYIVDGDPNTNPYESEYYYNPDWQEGMVGWRVKLATYNGSLIDTSYEPGEGEESRLYTKVKAYIFSAKNLFSDANPWVSGGTEFPFRLQFEFGSNLNIEYASDVMVKDAQNGGQYLSSPGDAGSSVNCWNGEPEPFLVRTVNYENDFISLDTGWDTLSFRLKSYDVWPNISGSGLSQHGWQFVTENTYVEHYMIVKEIFKKKYYSDVIGRIGESITAPRVINHIIANELYDETTNPFDGYDYGLQTGDMTTGYNYDETLYTDWYYDFTINETIESKKLIEGISSVSPFIARFSNLGEFKFDVIKELYDQADIDSSIANGNNIKKSEVISYSYARTKIEDVKTSLEFLYKYDYAQEDFLGKVLYTLEDVFSLVDEGGVYNRSYYGLIGDDDSSLLINDDRGKYIRDDNTAQQFVTWFLRWHCNQHLKIKIKLPLIYLDIEVGSIITFDEVLGEVFPYGIDYASDAVDPATNIIGSIINGQQVFPLFLCTSTNKTLEYIDIECIQLHNLGEQPVTYGSYIGCMIPGKWNTYGGNLNGINDDALCVNAFDYMQGSCYVDENPIDDATDNYSNNYTPNLLDLFVEVDGYPDIGNWLPNVFVVGETQENYVETFEAARLWWESNDYPMPNDANAPKIYDYSVCTWQNTIYHKIDSINISIKDSNGNYVPFGKIENNFINITLTEALINEYSSSGGLWVKFTYNFIINIPTYSGDSLFKYDCSTNDITIIDGGEQEQLNVYTADYDNDSSQSIGKYTSEVFLKEELGFKLEDDPDTVGIEEYYFTLKYNLSLASEQVYNEILNEATLIFTSVSIPSTLQLGDMNGDGGWNVLDIVMLANCVLEDDCGDLELSANGDINQDGGWNVLDVVSLAKCVLDDNCNLLDACVQSGGQWSSNQDQPLGPHCIYNE